MSSVQDTVRAVLARHGTTFAAEAGISLADEPAPLFQLLVLTELLAARIGAGIAVAAAVELRSAGLTTPAKMRNSTRSARIAALGRGGYRRYDERTATQLGEAAQLVLDRYSGDLRGLADEAEYDVGAAARLLQEVNGIGPTGASVFLREVQQVWPWVRPYLDDRTRAGAERVALPGNAAALAELVPAEELASFAAGLVRISLLPARADPLAD
jgi:co-chaperonin GroES (HSP10)